MTNLLYVQPLLSCFEGCSGTVVFLAVSVTHTQCHFLGSFFHLSCSGIGKGSLSTSGKDPKTSTIQDWQAPLGCQDGITPHFNAVTSPLVMENRCKLPRRPDQRKDKRMSIMQYKERAKVNMYFETNCHPSKCLHRAAPHPQAKLKQEPVLDPFCFLFRYLPLAFIPRQLVSWRSINSGIFSVPKASSGIQYTLNKKND